VVEVDDADVLEILQRSEFTEESRTAITSTDVPKVLGLNRYGTPLTVYHDKRGESEERSASLPAWLGLRLENVVAELYVGATGTPLRTDDGFYRHPEYPWLAAHLDRRAVGDGRLIVELKTRNNARGWGEDGSADIPADVWTQVQIQAACVGAREVHVATLFSNTSFRVYRIEPDPAFMETVLPILQTLWFDHIQVGIPPMVTGADPDTRLVQRTGGGESGVLKAATPEQEQLVAEYRLARMNTAQSLFALKGAENRIKVLIGEEADGLRGAFGVIYWKRTKEVETTDWELVAKVYRAAVEGLFELAAPGDDDEKLAEYVIIRSEVAVAEGLYTTTRPGSRVFRPNLREE